MLRMIMGLAQMSAVIRKILLLDDSYISLASVFKKELVLYLKQMSILEEEWRRNACQVTTSILKKFSA